MMEGVRGLTLLILSICAAYAVKVCPGPESWHENVFLQHEDCQKFYKCVFGQPIEMSCGAGLYFNLETSQCDWKANVDCPTDESDEEQGSQFLENGCPRDPSVHLLLPHEYDCSSFYTCIWGRKLKQRCPGSLHFDFKQQICGWPKPEGCVTSNEDSSSENESSENNPSKEDNSTEDNTKEDSSNQDISEENDSKEDISQEDNSKENISKEDESKEVISEENDTIEDVSKEDSSSESSSENNSSEGDITIEDISEEDISQENDTKENESKESASDEDNSNEDDSSKDDTSEENTAEEDTSNDETEYGNIKKIEAMVDVNVLKKN